MSDDDTLEELLDENLDDDLFDGDADDVDDVDDVDVTVVIGDGEDGEDDPIFDDDDEDDGEVPPEEEVAVSLDASEDGDDELDGEPPVDLGAIEGIEGIDVDDPLEVAAEVEGDADDTIRDGEFVCSSCHMAKRSSALADADELLCRDCV